MKQLARRYVYWKSIDKDIERKVRECTSCVKTNSNPTKAPLHTWDEPQRNWQRVHIDYAGIFQGYYYLVVIDAKSKWAEIGIIKEAPTTKLTIEILLDLFARHGYPDVLVSDNATIFTSSEFQQFCKQVGIFQKFIAPGHPATNGLAERNVQTLKRRLKAMESDSRPVRVKVREILFRYRATPMNNGKTPSEQYLNRQIRIQLDAIKPIEHNPSSADKCKARQLSVGDRVLVRYYSKNKSLWRLGTIRKKFGHLHYWVRLDNGFEFKRHINQLKATVIGESVDKTVEQSTKKPEQRYIPNLQDLVEIPQTSDRNFTDLQTPSTGQQNPRNGTPHHIIAEEAGQSTPRRSGRIRREPTYLNNYYR